MVVISDGQMVQYRDHGLVPDVYPSEFLDRPAHLAIGHNRYATQGPPSTINLQPHQAVCGGGVVSVASNGDLPMYAELRESLELHGVSFMSTNDSEVIAWWLAKRYDQRGSMVQAIGELIDYVDGAFAAVILFEDRLYVCQDRRGFRPMVIAPLPTGGLIVASEEAALDIHRLDRSSYQPIGAGALIEFSYGLMTVHRRGVVPTSACLFELIYFSRPDGRVFGTPVSLFRRRVGWRLAQQANIVDCRNAVVVAVPDSANEMAAGVAEALVRPLVPALIRAHSARRTFIESEQRTRDEGVRYKLNPDEWLLRDRDVLLIDDSIVRGTTMHSIVRMIRARGARRIWLLIGSPPVRWPCFMGIATPTRRELIASDQSIDQIASYLEVDSLYYLGLSDVAEAAGPLQDWERHRFAAYLGPNVEQLAQLLATNQHTFCHACFSGQYPLPVPRSAVLP